jgi:flavin reductase (DIM6/NTAB) family NADH-FMN oxidoreductase RutF
MQGGEFMSENPYRHLVSLEMDHPIWERFFSVAPLTVIGTREESGEFDLAPKHMVTPLGWDNYFGFVCAPTHSTYRNIEREKSFTVSFPRPDQVLFASLAASPRWEDGSKLPLEAVPTIAARLTQGVFLRDSRLMLECELDRIVDGFGPNSLIAGKIVAAHAAPEALRGDERDDQDVLRNCPLFAYLHPNRFAEISGSQSFPLPSGFRR